MVPSRTFPRPSFFWTDQIDDDGDGSGDGDDDNDGGGDCDDSGDGDGVGDVDGEEENEGRGSGEGDDGLGDGVRTLQEPVDTGHDQALSDVHLASGELDSIFAR